jgi:tRNA (guanine-N7-)-methyltransferase
MPHHGYPETLCRKPGAIADQAERIAENLKNAGEVEVEIGFGNGEYLIRRASEYPQRTFIGIEKKPGLIKEVAKKAERMNFSNILLLHSCAREAFSDLFPACSISRAYALFPDPWPKRKHIKYRLFSSEYLRLLNNRLIPGSEALIVTDSEDYCNWILKQTPDTGFEIENGTIPPQFDTRFERLWRHQSGSRFFRIQLKKVQHLDP